MYVETDSKEVLSYLNCKEWKSKPEVMTLKTCDVETT